MLFSGYVLCICFHQFEPVLFALITSIERKCAIDNKLVDGRGIILVAFDDYFLDAYFFLEGHYDLDGQSRVSVHISIIVVLQDSVWSSDTLRRNA